MSYKYYKCPRENKDLTHGIVRISDNAFIPFDDDTRDYVEYKEWLAEGNTPAASDNL